MLVRRVHSHSTLSSFVSLSPALRLPPDKDKSVKRTTPGRAARSIVGSRGEAFAGQSRFVTSGMAASNRYADASREELLARISELELSQTTGRPASGIAASSSTPTSTSEFTRDGPTQLLTGQGPLTHGASSEAGPSKPKKKKKPTTPKPFDVAWYPCRKIALRFAYDGANYSGLEVQSRASAAVSVTRGDAPVRTVEGELWKVLCEARLVDDAVGMQGSGWSRCGRTDRGVSAAGQVIALWVRSRRVDEWPQRRALERLNAELLAQREAGLGGKDEDDEDAVLDGEPDVPSRHEIVRDAMANVQVRPEDQMPTRYPADPEQEEMSYVSMLNSLLPPDIRVQAWSPVSPGFSSRFDCRYRHYKYFFTEGAPWSRRRGKAMPTALGPRLDIQAMRNAAQRFIGEHDFRHLCKVDGSKQITNYQRRIDGISIDIVDRAWTRRADVDKRAELSATLPGHDDDDERMYVLNLRGTAFLYHQVRHIMAVLFLVGAGLEKPSIVDELLNVQPGQVHKDRLLAARLHGLVLDVRGGKVTTELPQSSASVSDSMTSLDVANAARIQRAQYMADALTGATKDVSFLTEEQRAALEPLRAAFVFDLRPAYEMASDRPLMLWDCGFKKSDIEWRAGTYDGPLASLVDGNASTRSIPQSANVNMASLPSRKEMHTQWTQHMIAAEMARHMLLALPSDGNDEALGFGRGAGYLPAGTRYDEACFPALESCIVPDAAIEGSSEDDASVQAQRRRLVGSTTAIPLGNGRVRSQPNYTGLHKASRLESPEEINLRYRQGKGAKVAERKSAAAKAAQGS